MKFHQAPLGQPFEYQGQHFIKTSPIIAWCDETESQQLLPRSAEVQVYHQSDNQPVVNERNIPLQHARQVLLKWHDYCLDCLQSINDNPVPEKLAQVHSQLEQARSQFLSELETIANNDSPEESSE